VEQGAFSHSKVLPAARSLLAQQISRSLAVQNELLSDPLIDLKTAAVSLGGCSYATLCRYIRLGKLRVWRLSPRGKRKIKLSSLRALLAEGEKGGVQP
jgi:hypothetical protein